MRHDLPEGVNKHKIITWKINAYRVRNLLFDTVMHAPRVRVESDHGYKRTETADRYQRTEIADYRHTQQQFAL